MSICTCTVHTHTCSNVHVHYYTCTFVHVHVLLVSFLPLDLPVTHLQLLLLVWGSFSDVVRKELLLKCVAALNKVAAEKE